MSDKTMGWNIVTDLSAPLGWRKPRRVWADGMFDDYFDSIDKVFAVMALCPQHTFQVLTKRPERAAEYFIDLDRRVKEWDNGEGEHEEFLITTLFDNNEEGDANDNDSIYFKSLEWMNTWNARHLGWPLPNVWIGTSVEDQDAADKRISHLLKVPAAVRFLSCEPLLGPVDLDAIKIEVAPGFFGSPLQWFHRGRCHLEDGIEYPTVNWVIVGGESGPKSRPMHPAWVQSLRDQCHAAGVPFFFKQWGEWEKIATFDEFLSVCESANKPVWITMSGTIDREAWRGEAMLPKDGKFMHRVGKKAAGRLLDGRTWDQFPTVEVKEGAK